MRYCSQFMYHLVDFYQICSVPEESIDLTLEVRVLVDNRTIYHSKNFISISIS